MILQTVMSDHPSNLDGALFMVSFFLHIPHCMHLIKECMRTQSGNNLQTGFTCIELQISAALHDTITIQRTETRLRMRIYAYRPTQLTAAVRAVAAAATIAGA